MSEPRLIDANALRTLYCEYFRAVDPENPGDDVLAVGDCVTALDAAPTIDPVRHAHWILHPEIGIGDADKECSACGAMSPVWSHYCHNCGARMDEEVSND